MLEALGFDYLAVHSAKSYEDNVVKIGTNRSFLRKLRKKFEIARTETVRNPHPNKGKSTGNV